MIPHSDSTTGALRAIFPVVAAITGAQRFADFGKLYRSPYPYDDSPGYGEAFPEFLELLQLEDLPFLVDMAQLEWLVHCAKQAMDAPTLDAAALSAVPSDQFGSTRLALHPSCGLQQSLYPVARLWEIHQPGYAGLPTVDAIHAPSYILVNRPGAHVEVSNIDEGGHAFLDALARGMTLGAAFGFARTAKTEFDLGDALQDAAARRLLCAVEN